MSAAATAVAAAPRKSGTYAIAVVAGLAAFMEVLDISIANVALHHIAGSLSATPEEATWVLTSYLMSNAIILPMTGWLSDTIGRRRYYLLSMAVFTIASVCCGLAPSLPILIACRVVQGLAGGALQPVSQAILADAFPPEKRGMALAFYSMAVITGPAIGPTLGGLLTDNFSWHWIFLINAPVGVVMIAAASAVIRDPPAQLEVQRRRRTDPFSIDYLGFALIVLSMGALQLMLDKGQQEDWLESGLIVGCLVVSVVSLVTLVWWEWRHPHPVVNLRLLRNRNFASANVLMFLLGVAALSAVLLMPQFMQQVLGYSATSAGLVMSPGALLMICLMPVAGRFSGNFDARKLIAIGFLILAYSLYESSLINTGISQQHLLWLRMLQVMGMPFLMIPTNTMAYVGLSPGDVGSATAIINLMRNVGSSVGISMVTTLLARGTQIHQTHLIDRVSPLDPAYQESLGHLTAQLGSETAAHAAMAAQISEQAVTLAFIDNFRLLALVALCALPLIAIMRRPAPGVVAPPGAH